MPIDDAPHRADRDRREGRAGLFPALLELIDEWRRHGGEGRSLEDFAREAAPWEPVAAALVALADRWEATGVLWAPHDGGPEAARRVWRAGAPDAFEVLDPVSFAGLERTCRTLGVPLRRATEEDR